MDPSLQPNNLAFGLQLDKFIKFERVRCTGRPTDERRSAPAPFSQAMLRKICGCDFRDTVPEVDPFVLSRQNPSMILHAPFMRRGQSRKTPKSVAYSGHLIAPINPTSTQVASDDLPRTSNVYCLRCYLRRGSFFCHRLSNKK